MNQPRAVILTLAALAVVCLAGCSHPRQKAVKNWLSTPSWTPGQCAAPCGAPPPPQQHPQH